MKSSIIQIQFRWLEALFSIFIRGGEMAVFEAAFCACLCVYLRHLLKINERN